MGPQELIRDYYDQKEKDSMEKSSACFPNNISILNINPAINRPFGETETSKIHSTVQNINLYAAILLHLTCKTRLMCPFPYSR